jgi:hypothetical protein
MRYKLTFARIGMQLPSWFLVERSYSVVTDGGNIWLPNTNSLGRIDNSNNFPGC